MSITELVGWLALLSGGVALFRTFAVKRGPNLTHPLVKEIETLQGQRNQDMIEKAKLELAVQKRDTLIEKLRKAARAMRVTITLLRNQVRSTGHTPAYGAEYETGPLEGESDDPT